MNVVMKVASQSTINDPRWYAIITRDFNASFFYGVATTGVYCRPSCGARLPRPENVSFHRTPKAAERAGFRPCKRCQPNAAPSSVRRAEMVTQACRAIAASEKAPRFADLARRAGVSAHHFHRLFKQVTGLTPKGYAAALREGKLRKHLKRSSTVTEAIYDSGYATGSRFYEKSNAVLGMTPSRFRAGGADTEIRFAVRKCTLGKVLAAQSPVGICAILLGDDSVAFTRELKERFPNARIVPGGRDFAHVVADVVKVIDDPAKGLGLPLDVRGTAFQKRVWDALCRIPAGETATYTEIAKYIGAPKAVRAVGAACGANAIGVVIPCHRAVRSDGTLAGYRWGLARKRALLKKES
jgi:AraC family transcriptional regulator, regulatory protein of adaptative response / methylated-DNA-[protein]-cysteine methyltransferase